MVRRINVGDRVKIKKLDLICLNHPFLCGWKGTVREISDSTRYCKVTFDRNSNLINMERLNNFSFSTYSELEVIYEEDKPESQNYEEWNEE